VILNGFVQSTVKVNPKVGFVFLFIKLIKQQSVKNAETFPFILAAASKVGVAAGWSCARLPVIHKNYNFLAFMILRDI
jgi:hypothetical protein